MATDWTQFINNPTLGVALYSELLDAEQGAIQLSLEPRQGPLWPWEALNESSPALGLYAVSFFSSARPKAFHSHLGELSHLPVFVASIRMKLFEFHLNGILPLRD